MRVWWLIVFVLPAWAGERPSLTDGYGQADFQAYIGQRFEVFGGLGIRAVEHLTLESIEDRGVPSAEIEQFTLHFSGQLQGDLPKGRYWFQHPDSGKFRLFVEPQVDQDDFARVAVDMLLLKQ